jgi:hypothetical protein
MVLPISRVARRASSSRRLRISAAARASTVTRSSTGRLDQPLNASRQRTSRSPASTAECEVTSASCSPVAGFTETMRFALRMSSP